jgi:hypothetical protein
MGRGIYADMGANQDDYVVRKDHRGRFIVDRVGRSGTHVTIGSTAGFSSKATAMAAARGDGMRRDYTSGIILELRGDDLHQIGQVKKSHEAHSRKSGSESVVTFKDVQLAKKLGSI